MSDDRNPGEDHQDDQTLPIGPETDDTLPLDGTGATDQADDDAGTIIGPYRLVRRVGQGGMGDVYEAEQSEPIRRRVALKVIKQGMDTRAVVARFDAERQALALMDHPCIAKVFDAGATAQGRPFFVMEFVEGEPINEYCNRRKLDTAARLELFVRVCEGVQHAHQKAVIHRDLKPSNILVTEIDGQPVPKIIDFGVAKATTQRLTEMTMFTEMGQIIGTPEYMSPEQAAASDDDIDTRTDVYALGVVLYELLAGALPFESKELRKAGYDAIRRIICEQDPPRPSTRFSSLGQRATAVATAHGTAPNRLRGELSGDLDWITMKALEKDRDRRYETANGLAADIRRHLKNEPVTASPPSASYRLGKLVRRNRRTFAALGAIAVTLVAAAVVSSVMYVRAEHASQVARREASKSDQVSRFLGDMLDGVGPQVAQGADTKLLSAILTETDERIGKELASEPEVEATLRLRLSYTYRQMGDHDAAQQQLDRVQELGAASPLSSPPRYEVLNALGSLAWARNEMKEAEARYREALADLDANAPEETRARAEMGAYLANVVQEMGSYAEADSIMKLSLAYYRSLPEETDELAVTLNSLGNLARYQGDPQAAETCYREALDIHRRVLGDSHPYLATDLHNLGRLLDQLGKADEGEQMLREAYAIHQKVYHGPHKDTALVLRSMSEVALGHQRYDEADSLANASYVMTRQFYGDRNEMTLRALLTVAEVKAKSGRAKEAEAILTEVVAASRDTANTDPVLVSDALYRLATSQVRQGRFHDALKSYDEAIKSSTVVSGPDHPNTLLFRNDYARVLSGLGEDEAALKQLQTVLAARERILGPENPATAITRMDLGLSLYNLDRLDEAEAMIRKARDDYGAANGMDHPGVWNVTLHLANALRDLGRYDEAEEELRQAEVHYVRESGESSGETRRVRTRLATVYLRAGRKADADRMFGQALDEAVGPLEPKSRARTLFDRGTTLMKMDRYGEAARDLRESYNIFEEAVGAANGETQRVVRYLVELFEAQKKSQDAAAWRARLI